jgi:ABC-type phosphate transport system substrate-binding protein
MATSPKKLFAAGTFVLAALGLCAASASASAASESHHPRAEDVLKAKKKGASKSKKAKGASAAAAAGAAGTASAFVDEPEPDITDTTVTEYACELGNKITIYTNEGDDGHIALRWKKRLHRLNRVGTTTGALRFENANYGLIWIGIPSKGILLDSKLNRQLANECKNAEQAKPIVASAAEEKKG